MAQVDVSVNGQTYRIACEDGQENRLIDLAAMVDEKVMELVNQIGQVGSNRLLVMAALVIADELVDLKNETRQQQDDNPAQKDTVLFLQENINKIEEKKYVNCLNFIKIFIKPFHTSAFLYAFYIFFNFSSISRSNFVLYFINSNRPLYKIFFARNFTVGIYSSFCATINLTI